MAGGKTILVVDDERAIRLLCRVNLELEGLSVLEAGDLVEARACLERCEVDAILLDAHLGSDRGADLLRELRDAEIATPVAFLTGDSMLSAEDRQLADGVVEKPFDLDQLSTTVRRLLAVRDAQIR